MTNSIKETKKELLSIGNKADQMKERICDLKDRNLEMTQREKETELSIKKRHERILQELYDSIEQSNIRIIEIPEEEEREKGTEPSQTNS